MIFDEDNYSDTLDTSGGATVGSNAPPPLRVIVGLGDQEREQRLLPTLTASGQVDVVDRCLAAEQILTSARRNLADVALIAFDLHRLTDQTLADLARTGLPFVILIPANGNPWPSVRAIAVPLDADAGVVAQALQAAIRGEDGPSARSVEEPVADRDQNAEPPSPRTEMPTVITVAGGHGSPGRTMVALNLAVALGAVAPTALVDADCTGPSLAAYLDADPTRNLVMVAHAEPASPRDWDRVLSQENQPLGTRSPHGVVLCGIPKPAMRTSVSPRLFGQMVAELRPRYRFVILDVGADLFGEEVALHRAALAHADRILLVSAASLVGLWHARTALGLLKEQLAVPPEQIALIINQHDRRYHHARSEIEWALGMTAAAVIPYDRAAVERAILAQRPLVVESRGRAARAILDLAARVHGGKILLPPEPTENGQRRGALKAPLGLPTFWKRGPRRRQTSAEHAGVSHGSDATSVH